MPNDEETFNDVIDAQRGIFGADAPGLAPALANHDGHRKSPSADGMQIMFECSRCGGRRSLMVEWPELVAMRFGVPPGFAYQRTPGIMRGVVLDWKWDAQDQVWWPELTCPGCHRRLLTGVSPAEIESSLTAGRSRGWLPEQAFQQFAQIASQAAQAARGGR
jgi:hypothetical protein